MRNLAQKMVALKTVQTGRAFVLFTKTTTTKTTR